VNYADADSLAFFEQHQNERTKVVIVYKEFFL